MGRDVHLFLDNNGFDYVGSLLVDDIFVRKDLNTPERYGITEDLDDLMDTERVFYHLYDLKKEGIPNEQEWDMRIEQLEFFDLQPSGGEAGRQLHSEQPIGHQARWQQSTEKSQSRKHEL